MKICPRCGYQGDQMRCPKDGSVLGGPARFGRRMPEPGLTGRIFNGRYQVEALLGQGGMAWVFKARHMIVQHHVALKVLHKSLAEDEKEIKRFYNEACALSRLTHPNTIKVHDFGCSEDGYLFIAMELLEGQSLAEVIGRSAPFDLSRMAHIAIQICKSLDEAHDQGIVHRDLKPENIHLCTFHKEHDWVKVLDFGIAKLGGVARTGQEGDRKIIGTPRYMSPEQIRGKPLTPASDLYSLGVILFEMMTGQVPFDGDTRPEILIKHLKEAPPPLPSLVAGQPVPVMLRNLVEQLLEKDPGWRPSSAAEVRERLLSLIQPGPIVGPQAGVMPGDVLPPLSLPAPAAVSAVARAGQNATPAARGRSPMQLTPLPQGNRGPTEEPLPPFHALLQENDSDDTPVTIDGIDVTESKAMAAIAVDMPTSADTMPPEVPTQLPIRIVSVPAGARIMEDRQLLGATPLVVLVGWGESRTFTCALQNYMAKRFTLRATDGPAIKVTLRPLPEERKTAT